MELNLLPIINADGKRLDLDAELDFSDKDVQDVIFLSPVRVKGALVNVGGSVELEAQVFAKVRYVCDRCCEMYDSSLAFSMKELLKKEDMKNESGSNPDIIYFAGNTVDIDEIVLGNVFLNLPTKRICSESCCGLCPSCGKNLNLGKCECDTRVADPRFDALDKFFE